MSSKTKIIVLKSKELIYTGIFIVLGILLILLLWYMFSPKEDEKDTTDTSISTETFATYQPGVYTSQLNLGAPHWNYRRPSTNMQSHTSKYQTQTKPSQPCIRF